MACCVQISTRQSSFSHQISELISWLVDTQDAWGPWPCFVHWSCVSTYQIPLLDKRSASSLPTTSPSNRFTRALWLADDNLDSETLDALGSGLHMWWRCWQDPWHGCECLLEFVIVILHALAGLVPWAVSRIVLNTFVFLCGLCYFSFMKIRE